MQDHEDMITALSRRDPAALRAVLLAHLFKKRDVVMAQLAEFRSQPLAGKGAQA
jgi:DNA-binding GntR family transcriptional regulator